MANATEDLRLRERIRRIDTLLQEIDKFPDPQAKGA